MCPGHVNVWASSLQADPLDCWPSSYPEAQGSLWVPDVTLKWPVLQKALCWAWLWATVTRSDKVDTGSVSPVTPALERTRPFRV